jgi:hypothetical protein
MQGIISADWLKFVLHTVLSFFIALMAPEGIKSLLDDRKPEQKRPEERVLRRISMMDWIHIMWAGEKTGKMVIPSEMVLKTYCKRKEYAFDTKEHQRRLEYAVKHGLMSNAGALLATESEALRIISEA